MHASTHYYVLSLGAGSAALYEAFRDALIAVENQGFPVRRVAGEVGGARMARAIDESFGVHYAREALGLVIVGTPQLQTEFDAATRFRQAIVGRVFTEQCPASPEDLGRIAWPVVREQMSGVLDRAMDELADASIGNRLVRGLESVAAATIDQSRGTLLVEEDYRVRGSVVVEGRPPMISPEVDVRDAIDDAVDVVIERVLQSGGHVVFTRPGMLERHGRIALMPREENGR